MLTVQAATEAFYQCGLTEDAATKVAQATAPVEGDMDPPRLLFWYLSHQNNRRVRFLQSKAELQDMLRAVGFRPDVVPRATYPDVVLSHGVAEDWVERFARYNYGRSSSTSTTPVQRRRTRA
ncbi:hypothetical protein OH77DRAFT_1523257 [Trametes cingulata]|nr:hypothetical protein OH77DRAFT_1523257 [Trametes cingulata]